jgi:nucleotide-binding universal stress UspA family protein
MFEKILVCLDGSSFAEHILPYAMEQAKHFESKIVLLRVIPTFPAVTKTIGEPELVAEVAEPEDITNKEAKAMAYVEGVITYLEERGLNAEGVIIKGVPDEAIVAYAGQHDIDLITLATHGHSGLGRVVCGSVADYVLKESGIPVLAIRPKESES